MAQNTGTFFKVNDNDGIPLVGVSTNGKVVIAPLYGNLGIGTTNPREKLDIIGNVSISGIITATSYRGDGSQLTGIVASGIVIKDDGSVVGTAGTIDFGSNLSVSAISAGVVTVTASASGGSGIATYATTAGVSTSVIGGIGSITQLQVTGISTFTNGPILVGTATSTGTASQRLQVTGGAAFYGTGSNVGIGTTNPTSKLYVVGDTYVTGIITANSYRSVTSGVPTIESSDTININTPKVAISTDLYVGGVVSIGATITGSKLSVNDGDLRVGVNTSYGLMLTSPNGTKYRLVVNNSGNLSTVLVP